MQCKVTVVQHILDDLSGMVTLPHKHFETVYSFFSQ